MLQHNLLFKNVKAITNIFKKSNLGLIYIYIYFLFIYFGQTQLYEYLHLLYVIHGIYKFPQQCVRIESFYLILLGKKEAGK